MNPWSFNDFREIIISVSLRCSHRQQSKLIVWLGLQVTHSAVLCVDTNKTAHTRTLFSLSHLQLCTPAHSFHLIPAFVFLFFDHTTVLIQHLQLNTLSILILASIYILIQAPTCAAFRATENQSNCPFKKLSVKQISWQRRYNGFI